MKKLFVLLATALFLISARADLAYFQFEGGKLYNDLDAPLLAGSHDDIALIFVGDYTGIRDQGSWRITDFDVPHAYLNIGIAPSFLGTYQTEIFSERPSALIGKTITLVIDPNGGGLQVGDIIGISDPVLIQDMADVSGPFPSAPQTINLGDIFINIQEVPEPSTMLLFGIGGIGAWLQRKSSKQLSEI